MTSNLKAHKQGRVNQVTIQGVFIILWRLSSTLGSKGVPYTTIGNQHWDGIFDPTPIFYKKKPTLARIEWV